MVSCFSNRKISSFQQLGDQGTVKMPIQVDSSRIESQDILQIHIDNLDEQTGILINTYNANGTYTPDRLGFIRFPLLGNVKATGITKNELSSAIESALIAKNIALNPLVSIKTINFKVTVLGEVNKPGVITIPEESIAMPELLGLAGDLTAYAKRNNLLLIRESNGNKTYQRFSLNDTALFNSQIYFLQNRDILYVEPNSAKAFNSSQSRAILGFVTGILTLFILVTGLKQ
jgi:polysaccharide biosynthesis/export protein